MNKLTQLTQSVAKNYVKQGTSYFDTLESCSVFSEFKRILDNLTLKDLNIPYDKSYLYNLNEPLKYLKVLDEEHFGMGIFFFPPGKGFPIHDHPGMMVATKILDGTLRSHSYNILEREKQARFWKVVDEGKEEEPHNKREFDTGLKAINVGYTDIKTGEAVYLTHQDKNAHTVKALENCAMLDVFIPNLSTRHFYTVLDKEENGKEEGNKVKLRMNTRGSTFNLTNLKYDEFKNK